MPDAILVLNAGSSSLKFAVYPVEAGAPSPILRGKIAGIGNAPVFSARDGEGRAVPQNDLMRLNPGAGIDDLIPALLDWLKSHQGGVGIVAAGHRVVHGGRNHTGPARVSTTLLAEPRIGSPSFLPCRAR